MGEPLDTRAHIARLLQRTGFGARPAEVDAAVAAGFDDTVDRILTPGDDPGAAETPVPHLAALPKRGGRKGRTERADAKQEPERDPKQERDPKRDPRRKAFRAAVRAQREDLTLWWLDRMTAVHHPWPEKRTLLWHNHWATSIQKVKSGRAMLAQNQTLRHLGGGDFRSLARAMVRDPALMLWLDAAGNTATAPNENLARELMELFVLGVGHYTETDVRQAAAALTGWGVDRQDTDGWTARYRPRDHAQGPQTVLGTTTDFTATSLVDHLVAQPASPRHLATRFWQRLVSSDTPPSAASLERITAAYGDRRDTTAMVRAMLADPAFADRDSVLVKEPVEYVVGTLRAFGLRPAELPKRRMLVRVLTGLGQVPFAPPNVGGWPDGAAWLTTSAARVRITFAQQVAHRADLSAVRKAAASDRPALLARLLGVPAWGDATAGVLADASRDPRRVTAIAITAPEHLVLP